MQLAASHITKNSNTKSIYIAEDVPMTYAAAHAKKALELWPQFPYLVPAVLNLKHSGGPTVEGIRSIYK